MSKVAVIFWSGTGNTETMAESVRDGAKDAGADVTLVQVDDFKVADMANFDGFIFGCPAMGDEVLEEDSFEPFFAEAEGKIKDIPVGLFGSYGWGGGAWMESWCDRTKEAGAKLIGNVIAENSPDEEAVANCEQLGKDVVAAL